MLTRLIVAALLLVAAGTALASDVSYDRRALSAQVEIVKADVPHSCTCVK
jgi:hypothetical protein